MEEALKLSSDRIPNDVIIFQILQTLSKHTDELQLLSFHLWTHLWTRLWTHLARVTATILNCHFKFRIIFLESKICIYRICSYWKISYARALVCVCVCVCRASDAFIDNNFEEYFILSLITVNEIAVRSVFGWIQHRWFRNITLDRGLRLRFHERFLAALLTAALLKTVTAISTSGTAVHCCRCPTICLHLTARHKTAAVSLADTLVPAGGALTSLWPWQQRCGNNSARSWKYVHLKHRISRSPAKCSAAKNRSWKRSLTALNFEHKISL